MLDLCNPKAPIPECVIQVATVQPSTINDFLLEQRTTKVCAGRITIIKNINEIKDDNKESPQTSTSLCPICE